MGRSNNLTKILISKASAKAINKEKITSGMVNSAEIEFVFSSEWQNLIKIAVFSAGEIKRDVLLNDTNRCFVPHEVLEKHGQFLICGVYGMMGNDIVIPTINCSLGYIHEGAKPEGSETAEKTPELWEQSLNVANDALNKAENAEKNVDTLKKDVEKLKENGFTGDIDLSGVKETLETLKKENEKTAHKYLEADTKNSDFFEASFGSTLSEYTLFGLASEENPLNVRVKFKYGQANEDSSLLTINGEEERLHDLAGEIEFEETINSPIIVSIGFGVATFSKIWYYKAKNSGNGGITNETDPTVPTWAKQPTKPSYTADEVNADPKGTATSEVSKHNTSEASHNDIRLLIEGLSTRLNAIADSDDTTLDQMSEIVAYIKSNKDLIDAITTSKVSVSDIINNLTTNVSNKPLSAAQGVVLKKLIDDIINGGVEDITAAIDRANAAAEAANTTKKAIETARDNGEFDGADGTSPTVTVTAITGGHRISITDVNGTKNVDVMDGEDGQDGNDGADGRGISSIARTSGTGAAGTTDTYTITYTDGTKSTFTVYNGKNGTNGTSVTIKSVTESTESGGSNVVTFSDGKTLTVKNGKDGVSEAKIPDYWETAVENAVAKVKAIQNNGGKDVINFIHFSDMHYTSGGTNYTNNLGVVARKLMDELGIPLIVGTGDITESGTAASSEKIDSDVIDALATLKVAGLENLLYCKGNHDGAWGAKATYGVNYAMIQHPAKLWNRLYRWQAEDFRRVFSKDGSYYYVDNIPQKVRYIVLNSHWADYSNITDLDYDAQATEYNTQKNINYGDTQAEWLAKEALNFTDEGWTVVVFTHAPLWNKYNGVTKSYMNVQYAGTNNASTIRGILMGFYDKSASVTYKTGATVDYSNIGDNTIAGVFCGHCHTDFMVKHDEAGTGTDIPFPIVSITSAGNANSSYEEGFGMPVTTRTNGTDTETAFDIVCINKSTKTINTIRVGAGNDRSSFYGEESTEEVTLSGITATYTGGNVTVGTALTDLTEIVVTAQYSDGSTAPITDYTLSGSISTVGNNTITVSYGGLSTTFTVVGIEAESSVPNVVLNTNVFDKTADGFMDNYRISSSAASTGYVTTASSANQFMTNYIRIDEGMYLNVDVPGTATAVSTVFGGYMLSYDEEKNLIGTYTNLSGSISNNKYKYQVSVNGVAYVRLSPYKTAGSGITVDNCNIIVTTS